MNTFDFYRPMLDWDKIGERIADNPKRPLDAFELEDAKMMVFTAAERWLAYDLHTATIEGIEEEFVYDRTPGARSHFHGFVDLRFTLNGQGKPYDGTNQRKRNFAGTTMIADWKTRDGSLDSVWKNRLKNSWQWKLYAFGMEAAIFSYRGIARPRGGVVETEEVLLEVPESNGVEVREYLSGAFEQRQSYVDAALKVWPRHRPFACKPYGRECPFEDDCHAYSMPKEAAPDRQLSYSSIGDLLMCPEYHRRKSLSGEREDTDATIFGLAVHRGLEELYGQARRLQNG